VIKSDAKYDFLMIFGIKSIVKIKEFKHHTKFIIEKVSLFTQYFGAAVCHWIAGMKK
jgi:hypothetical protein